MAGRAWLQANAGDEVADLATVELFVLSYVCDAFVLDRTLRAIRSKSPGAAAFA